MRLSYPGITKLVVVKSVYNDTPAGRAAIDVVARYFGGLSSATQRRSIAAESLLASKGCTQCQKDLRRIQGYIEKHEQVEFRGRAAAFRTAAIFVSQISDDGVVVVRFDGTNPPLSLVDARGRRLGTDKSGIISATLYVDTNSAHASILQLD